jgi:hypothetical protein
MNWEFVTHTSVYVTHVPGIVGCLVEVIIYLWCVNEFEYHAVKFNFVPAFKKLRALS